MATFSYDLRVLGSKVKMCKNFDFFKRLLVMNKRRSDVLTDTYALSLTSVYGL